jgi:hypothetical protein
MRRDNYIIVNGLGNIKKEISMVTALRAVVVATAETQPKDSTIPNTDDTPERQNTYEKKGHSIS